ncbi:hypothetical protein F511_41143 [Dorcoceras hygrometricum]|uniref:Uncharacterized protein n=1 Tax=Dorcoceras hygrometricum TaxID=472368 RepID=A0A2Z7BVL9_9LAMI|nr:hypothetical protein F511_41143 [Dorcoceras hygrometricum]
MCSIDERIVVEAARSLGSTSSSEGEGTSSPPDKASCKRILARINADAARLTAEGRPWYEVRASLLQESDKAIIRDLSGMSDHYEIMIPMAEDRAHLPPEGYHTFYLNHLEMGLRFPVPRFIQNLCDHFRVSPSQLIPNSYSSLLALGAAVAWHCDMSWFEKPTRRDPPLPAQEYDPSAFLDSQDLNREDLLCHFGFSRKGVEVEEDLADRIMKAQLLEAYKKQELGSTKGPSPPLEERVKEKRKKLSSGGDKHPRKKTSSTVGVDKEAGTSLPEHSGVEDTSFITHRGELSRRVSNAREVARSSRRSLDEMMVQHDKLMRELEDVRGASDVKKRSLMDKLVASEASVARLQEEMKRMQEEAEATWMKRKEYFLKSSEFDQLCSTRALSFFEQGFNGCLAQFRANGYSEAEHPASFLNVLKALEDFPEEGEVDSSSAPKK